MRYVRYIDPFYYSAASLRLFSRHGGGPAYFEIRYLPFAVDRPMDYLLAINPGIRWSADWTSDCSRYLIPGADGRGLLPDVFWFGRNSAQFPSIFVGGSLCCAICRRRPKKKKHNFAILVKWQGLSCVIIVNRYERYSKQKKKKKTAEKSSHRTSDRSRLQLLGAACFSLSDSIQWLYSAGPAPRRSALKCDGNQRQESNSFFLSFYCGVQ